MSERQNSGNLVDLHVFVVPADSWQPKYRTTASNAASVSTSAGFIRVRPDMALSRLRQHMMDQLGCEVLPQRFAFLRTVGRCMALVNGQQEQEIKVKHFVPPLTTSPELYVIQHSSILDSIHVVSSSETPVKRDNQPTTKNNDGHHGYRSVQGQQSEGRSSWPSFSTRTKLDSDSTITAVSMDDINSRPTHESNLHQVQKEKTKVARAGHTNSTSMDARLSHDSKIVRVGTTDSGVGSADDSPPERVGEDSGPSMTSMGPLTPVFSEEEVDDDEAGSPMYPDRSCLDSTQALMGVGRSLRNKNLPPAAASNQGTNSAVILDDEKSRLLTELNRIRAEREALQVERDRKLKEVRELTSQRKADRSFWKSRCLEEESKLKELEIMLEGLRQELKRTSLNNRGNAAASTEHILDKSQPNKTPMRVKVPITKQAIEDLKTRIESTKAALAEEMKARDEDQRQLKRLREQLTQKKIDASLVAKFNTPLPSLHGRGQNAA